MRSLIKKLHLAMGTTFVYVTHDQAEALTLADRITVMRDGLIQQLDTPDAIYNRPANRFVASFLGNPQMNFIEGKIAETSAGPRFVRGDFQLAVDPEVAAGQGGRDVVLGLRAEDAILAGDGGLAGAVTLVSPLGSEQHVDMDIAGVELTVRASKDQSLAIGDRLSLAVEPARLHLFDATSEQRLAASS
jgi:multiple sugar transport system ATP-binding protein